MGATAKTMHVDKVLSNVAIGYKPEGFIAGTLFPTVVVDKQSDIYQVYDRARKLRRQDTKRTPGTEAHKVTLDVGSAVFYCANYALKYPVTIEDKANADPAFVQNIINTRVELILDDLALDREMRVSEKVLATANVGSSAAVSSGWNGAGSPLTDMNAAIDNVRYANGVRPNNVTFGPEAWDSFRRDSTVRNLINGTNNGGGYVNEEQVRNLLNVEKVEVAGSFKNTGADGQAEAIQSIWGDNVLVSYTPANPTRERPSFGYEFRWQAAGLPNMQVERHPYNTKTKSEEVEVGYYNTDNITAASYGFLLTAVNSST